MTIYRVNVVLPYTTNLPRDIAMNAWHIQTLDDSVPSWEAVAACFESFYNDQYGTYGVRSFLGTIISRAAGACRIDGYEVGQTGPPVYSTNFTLGGATGTAVLPLELALCCSLVANAPGSVPRARRRGRVYIGPLAAGAISTAAPKAVPTGDFIDTLVGAAEALVDDLIDIVGNQHRLSIYSTVDETAYLVTGGWVDNEWDIQRRREVAPTDREVWGVID